VKKLPHGRLASGGETGHRVSELDGRDQHYHVQQKTDFSSLQCVAEFERILIKERTRAGVRADFSGFARRKT
jgi:hypothetical protein